MKCLASSKCPMRLRWVEYTSWAYHQGIKDPLPFYEWRKAWEAGVIK